MKSPLASNYAASVEEGCDSAELLVLPDGRILVHNLTPAVAALLAALAPHDADMRRRATLPALGHRPALPSPTPAPRALLLAPGSSPSP